MPYFTRLASLKANGIKKGVSPKWSRVTQSHSIPVQIKVVSHYMTQIDEDETRALAQVSCLYPVAAKHKALQIGAENNIPIA